MEKTQNTYTPPTKIWNYMFVSIFLASIFLNMGQQMSNSLLSLYAKSLGAPADQIGSLMSLFAVTALVLRTVSGPAMNTFNRKMLAVMAILFMAVAYMGFSMAGWIAATTGLSSITVLKGFRLLQGVGNAFGNASLLIIVADALPKDQFTAGMGYYASAQVVAQAIGPTVGVMLRDAVGYDNTFRIGSMIMLAAAFLTLRVHQVQRDSLPFTLRLDNMFAKEAVLPSLINFFVFTGFISINSFMLVYAEERGISNASFFFTVYALTTLCTRSLIGKLTEKYGFVKVSIPALFLSAFSLFVIGISSNLPMLLAAAFINAFGYGAVQPMIQSITMKSVPAERRGSASSTNYLSMDVATLTGPMISGYVASAFGYVPMMWNVMTIPVLMAVVVVLLSAKKLTAIEKRF